MNRINIVLLVLLASAVIVTIMSRVDHSRPNLEILPDMKYSPAWSAYAVNTNFHNGRTLQAPVPGTIARGEMPLHYTATAEDAVRAGEELLNPYDKAFAAEQEDSDQEFDQQQSAAAAELRISVQRGGELYRTYCVSCHGHSGAGDGPVVKRGFPPPQSLLTGKSTQMKDGQLFHILTYGQGSMSPMAVQLPRDCRWDVINFVRDMQDKAAESKGDEDVD